MKMPWKKTSVEDEESKVIRVEKQLRDDLSEVEVAQYKADAAIVAAAEENSRENLAARDQAETVLEEAKRKVIRTRVLLENAQQKLEQVRLLNQEEIEKKQWKEVAITGDQRIAATKEYMSLAQSLADKASLIKKLSADMLNKAPRKRAGETGSLLHHDTVDYALRLQLRKCGMPWAAEWIAGDFSIPSVLDKVIEGNAYVLSARPNKEVEEISTAEHDAQKIG